MSTFRIALAGTVVAGALLLTACGSSDSTDTMRRWQHRQRFAERFERRGVVQ